MSIYSLRPEATQTQDPATGKFAPVSLPGIPTGETTKKVAVKIAEKAGVSPATVYRVHAVHKNGAPEVKELMSKWWNDQIVPHMLNVGDGLQTCFLTLKHAQVPINLSRW